VLVAVADVELARRKHSRGFGHLAASAGHTPRTGQSGPRTGSAPAANRGHYLTGALANIALCAGQQPPDARIAEEPEPPVQIGGGGPCAG